VAGQLYAKQGVDQTKIEQVAEAAGMSVGSVYAHFGSKEALALAFAEEPLELLERRLAARSLNPIAAIQPRLASRFETDSPSPASGGAEAIATEPEISPVNKPAATSSPRTKTPAISNMEATDVSSRRTVEDFEEMPTNLNRVENQPQKISGPVTEAAPNLAELSPRNRPFSKMRRRTPPAENSAGAILVLRKY